MAKKISVRSNNQRGGITAHSVNINPASQKQKGLWANPTFKYIVIPILIGVLILSISIGADKMFGKDKTPDEVYNVESNHQSGGITAGKIDNVNMINPRPKSSLTYKTVTLNEKIGNLYQSEFLLTITIPQGGWVEGVSSPKSIFLKCEKAFPKAGDVIGGTNFSSNGQSTTEQHRIICTSSKPVEDDGNLFFLA
ncbi:hypothetical protein GOV14_02760 [Candidatus Pacearchaeota archaeon]|nr:hypothetical protein [Candidatus Pacearchaeota archaeon]